MLIIREDRRLKPSVNQARVFCEEKNMNKLENAGGKPGLIKTRKIQELKFVYYHKLLKERV